ncbi:hypothetical protein NP233_g11274 [Leucocoprinus birnbaumii]|uniref:SH3 domain-containing protein n=1 Tax=Leucocoprinus birnbaumii TaxID=56174 RepID=A0AAD5YLF3_9AGAR|nr:hypothetical protein NP233_g11274 [Leucocoprinus birnbaumii]
MYEIFTNERPFHKRSPAQVILKVAGGEIPTRPLSGPKSELCDRIWGLMVRCWSPNPKSRPTVGDVKVELMVVESTPPLQEGVQPRNAFQGPSAQNVRTRSRVTAFTKDELELLSRCNVKNNAPKHTYPLRFALAIRNHIAMSTSEITVAKGDELELIIYETKRWWLARKRQSGQIGLVPLDVFSPLGFPWGDLDHTREPEDSCDPFLDEAMVFQNHEADTDRYPDEISVKKGDKLRIAHCIGPSWLARKEDGSVGLVRFRHVYPDPSTTGPKFAAGKPTFKVRAKQEYDGDCEDPRIIPRFSEGEMMDVIDRSTDRWWLVRDKEGSLGWVQPKYLDDLSSGNIN